MSSRHSSIELKRANGILSVSLMATGRMIPVTIREGKPGAVRVVYHSREAVVSGEMLARGATSRLSAPNTALQSRASRSAIGNIEKKHSKLEFSVRIVFVSEQKSPFGLANVRQQFLAAGMLLHNCFDLREHVGKGLVAIEHN